MTRLSLILALLASLLLPVGAAAEPADSLTVSWLTAAPGDEVYQLEGHSALRLKAPWMDIVINWGVFDFNTPGFVWRFALGETDYMAAAVPTQWFVDSYTIQQRSVTEQVLRLSPGHKRRLMAMIDSTLTPGNDTYRYNYVLDNCATRPLDYLRRATGGAILVGRFPETRLITTTEHRPPETFRSRMTHYHGALSWYQFGIDLALGSGIDRPIGGVALGFAPVDMQLLLEGASIDGKPLVTETHLINPLFPPLERKVDPWTSPLAVAILLLLAAIVAVVRAWRRGTFSRPATALFFSLQALAGLLLSFLIFVSTHYATSPNWLYLWLNPLALLPPLLLRTPGARLALRIYFAVNLLGLSVLTVIFLFQVQGFNWAFAPLMATSALLSVNYICKCKS